MRVAVGSTNPVKIEAVRLAFAAVWPEKNWEVLGTDVKSGVSSQPMSDQEGIRGAKTRAKKALKILKADFGVGLEGTLNQINKNWYDCGWAVVIDKEGNKGVGSTVRIQTPAKMIKLIKKGKELGEANDIIFGLTNSKQAQGHFGIMTKNAITRTAGYRDGMIMALSRFLHPNLF